jgi:pyridoxal phosphate enzyme (YggS family)
MSVADKIIKLKKTLAEHVTLVAVSKTKPISAIEDAYESGHRDFGENRVQELQEKYPALPKDIRWHAIGHLQRNKVKYIAPFIHLIHSVDSLRLLKEINKEAEKNERTIKVLLQFHIAQEESKFGLDWDKAQVLLESDDYREMKNIEVTGVMGMATFIDNEGQVREEFAQLRFFFEQLKEQYFKDQSSFKEISMGMSGDYELAISEGSTMIRVGSSLFGARE